MSHNPYSDAEMRLQGLLRLKAMSEAVNNISDDLTRTKAISSKRPDYNKSKQKTSFGDAALSNKKIAHNTPQSTASSSSDSNLNEEFFKGSKADTKAPVQGDNNES